ncbi:MAG: nSTAND3 domain-containing NTPase [Methylobacter sp.]
MLKLKQSKAQASEITYELHSLGWKAFQDLCVTITSEIWGQTVQSFFDSHDGGRDGAFYGTWNIKQGESFQGAFTVQCKFTSKRDKSLTLPDLKDELVKAERLASRGLADVYILFTNARLTGVSEEKIKEAFEKISGIKHFAAYGCGRISQIIRESARLRMLVPRVYGLGDLSQILDERAYAQAEEILSALGDDLSKFVITDAYKKSAQALIDHGFVLLLGEPACGKSTIAAALAVGALDKWGCSTLKVCDSSEFKTHWNPQDPKQFFWVDDAFGATQIDWSSTLGWNRVFPEIHAAIRKGAKVLFTSRDYIYKAAKDNLKESALPVMKESQVVINVQDINTLEREKILYNHIRLGSQLTTFKKEIKPYLSDVARTPQFTPEIARRLGNPVFTKELHISQMGLNYFVTRPKELLREIIQTLDKESRSALALVFMRGGILPSPIEPTSEENEAVSLIGGSSDGIRLALNALNESLLIRTFENGSHMCRFKHPTIRDAFASLVADDLELLDIYLAGSPLDKLFNEVSCGDLGIGGVKVIVPINRYDALITRIKFLDTSKWQNRSSLNRFLSSRCDSNFLKSFIACNQQFIQKLSVCSYLRWSSEVDVIVRLFSFKLLPESERLRIVTDIYELAIDIPDSGFLKEKIKDLMTHDELNSLLEKIKTKLIPNLDQQIAQWEWNYNHENDPEEYFDELKNALEDYKNEFETDETITEKIDNAFKKIHLTVKELKSESPADKDDEDELFNRNMQEDVEHNQRSIFDDVDL